MCFLFGVLWHAFRLGATAIGKSHTPGVAAMETMMCDQGWLP